MSFRRLILGAQILLAVVAWPAGPIGAADESAGVAEKTPVIATPGRSGRPEACYLTPEFRTLDDFKKPFTQWSTITGDWGGTRCRLHDRGIIPTLRYSVEVMSKLAGGATKRSVGRVLGNLDLNLSVLTEPLFGWPGGQFFVHFENLVGRSNGVNPEVGFPFNVVTTLNNVDPFVRLMSYWYQQTTGDGRFGFKFGKQDAVVDFVTTDTLGQYLNLGVNPPGNVPMPTWPVPELGLQLFAKLGEQIEVSAGVYGGELTGRSFSDAGLFSGKIFAIAQVEGHPTLAGRPLIVQVGAWLSTTGSDALRGSRHFDWNFGPYLILDQELLRKPSSERSLRVWVQFTWAPPDRNENAWWLGGGVVWKGALPFVSGDALGIGFYHARASPDAPGKHGGESVIELFYKLPVTAWFELQPDLQYFINPAADGRSAFVAGARAVLEF